LSKVNKLAKGRNHKGENGMKTSELVSVVVSVLVAFGLYGYLFSLNWELGIIITVALLILGSGIWGWLVKKAIGKKDAKLFSWVSEEIGKDGEGHGDVMTTIFVFGLVEIRFVPTKYVWVTRHMTRSKEDDFSGFKARESGWSLIWLPNLINATVKMVCLRPYNIDLKSFEVNTTTTQVDVDTQVSVFVEEPLRFAITLREKLEEIVKQLLHPAINVCAAGYSSEQLTESEKKQRMAEIASNVTKMLNGVDPVTGKKYKDRTKSLRLYGIRIEVRIQEMLQLRELIAAKASVEASKHRVEVAKNTASAAKEQTTVIQEFRKVTGIPDGHWANLAFPLLAAAGLMGGGSKPMSLPKVSVDFGGMGGEEKEKKESQPAHGAEKEKKGK
jgi:hypothetical protein